MRPFRTAPLLLTLAAVAVALPALHGPFVLDDAVLVKHPDAASPGRALTRFPNPANRPLTFLSLAIDRVRSGEVPVPWVYRTTTLAIHLLNGWLLASIAGVLLGRRGLRGHVPDPKTGFGTCPRGIRRRAQFVAAGVYLLHPLLSQGTSYVAARSSMLAAAFGLAAVRLFLASDDAPDGPPFVRRVIASTLLTLGALLSKETAAVIPMLALILILPFPGSASPRRRRILRTVAGLLLFVFLLGAAGQVREAYRYHDRPLAYPLTQLRVIPRYAARVLLPAPLQLDADVDVLSDADVEGLLAGIPGLLGILAYGGLACLLLRRGSPVGAGLLWGLVALLPTSSLMPIGDGYFEHRMILPIAGLALAAGAASVRLGAAAGIPIAAVLVLYAGGFAARAADWSDGLRLWSEEARHAPRKLRVQGNLATMHARRSGGDPARNLARAERGYRIALRCMRPHDRDFLPAIFRGLHRVLDLRGGREAHLQALRSPLVPNEFPSQRRLRLLGLAALCREMSQDPSLPAERRERLLDDWERAAREIVRMPSAGAAEWIDLGIVLAQRGDPSGASAAFDEALRIDPDSDTARFGQATAAAESGDLDRALALFDAYLVVHPGDGEGRLNRAIVLARMGRTEEARVELRRVLEARPDLTLARRWLDRIETPTGD